MYNFQTSASKAGMSIVGPIIIFKHEGKTDPINNPKQCEAEALLGCTHSYILQNLITVAKKENVQFPRNYTDYNASIALSKLPKGIRVGFKYGPFDDVMWDHLDEQEGWFHAN
jgi:hypothetical protein